jgi:uncharacterized membrane protein YdjX (TVP38/TMEM64 family)
VILGSLWVVFRTVPVGLLFAELQAWIETLGAWGPLVFAAIYVLATVLLLPASLLTLAAGAMFGLGLGFVTVSFASTTGATCAFLIARYAARGKVERWAQSRPKFQAIDRAIDEAGWKIVALLRLSPAIPFNLQNYLYGLTSLRLGPYVLTSWIAMVPGTFLYVYLGHLAGIAAMNASDGGRQRTVWEWGLLAVGVVATIVVTVYLTRLAQAQLREITPPPVESASAAERPAEASTALPEAGQTADRRGLSKRLIAATLLMLALAVTTTLQSEAIEQWVQQAVSREPDAPVSDPISGRVQEDG